MRCPARRRRFPLPSGQCSQVVRTSRQASPPSPPVSSCRDATLSRQSPRNGLPASNRTAPFALRGRRPVPSVSDERDVKAPLPRFRSRPPSSLVHKPSVSRPSAPPSHYPPPSCTVSALAWRPTPNISAGSHGWTRDERSRACPSCLGLAASFDLQSEAGPARRRKLGPHCPVVTSRSSGCATNF